jgi:sarcosine oxidase, subunit beta
MSPLEADVAIVGGGIMGCSTALHLRRRGRSVVLLERGEVGAQASGVNFGHVRRQGRFLPQVPLAMRSREIWGRLEELVGDGCEFLPRGHLRLAFDDGQMRRLEAHARDVAPYGLTLRLLDRAEVRRRWPWLTEKVAGASLQPDDGHANPRLAAPAFARAARVAGAELREGEEVIEVDRDGRGFRLRGSSGLEVRAAALVNTAGAWSGRIAARFGEPVPLRGGAPQQAVTEPLPYFIGPGISIVDSPIYLRQIPRGNVIFGGGAHAAIDERSGHAKALPVNTQAQLARVVDVVPWLRHARLIRVWAGIDGYLPDSIPVIGPSRTTPGLFHAFGFCGHGFQLGPAVGAVLAELIVDGRSATPVDAFDIARFAA